MGVEETNVSDISPLKGLKNLKELVVDYPIIAKNKDLLEELRERGVDVRRV
ncbi:MAG: hypothetical protein GWN31_01165 [Candidatus Thorarchaeota archaeon]|nr:hypothetical protein [Candidatus Thorarchaeota archaeon]NIW12555.1 hypothetical protein [Candidatus Thorarchaeota archaeon]NIW50775.1 hypothetical protein [Candidatus Korarchaeota archaeon]